MKLSRATGIISALLLLNVACSPASPKLKPAPSVVYDKINVVGNNFEFNPMVDILFVVDRSGSMSGHQQNLSRNIELFTNELAAMNVDYHIGVITSDRNTVNYPNNAKLIGNPNFVSRNTPNGSASLKSNILVGISGDATEVFFDPLVRALSPVMSDVGKPNAGFLRTKAYFAVVFITDAEDQSVTESKDSAYQFLVSLKQAASKVLSYGIIIPSSLGASPVGCQRDEYTTPQKLEAFLALTINSKNNQMRLCDPNFGLALAGFSKDLVRYLAGTIKLERAPIVQTIRVYYGGLELLPHPSTGWYFDPKQNAVILGDNVVLDSAQGDGTGLRITFDSAQFIEESH